MKIILRQEQTEDYATVFKIAQQAFATVEYSDQSEPFLVERLRQSAAFVPELSMVAEQGGELLGHNLLTKIQIDNGTQQFEALALAPVSVRPDKQGQGIGSQLIAHAHAAAKNLGFKAIVLVGHADYYPRFGYGCLSDYSITLPFEVPDENAMVIELVSGVLKGVHGKVIYDKAFFE